MILRFTASARRDSLVSVGGELRSGDIEASGAERGAGSVPRPAGLAQAIDWPLLKRRFERGARDGPGMPPRPTRLMAGLAILKHTFNLSDEELCARWVETPISNICAARILPPQPALRPLVDDTLAGSHGRGAAGGAVVGKPYAPGDRRYHCAAEERHVPDRRQANPPGTRAIGAAGDEDRREAAPDLCPGRQIGADQAHALRVG